MQYIFHLYLNRTHTVTILVTTKKSTAVLAQMTTLKKYAKIYTKTTSKLFLTAYSTTLDEDFGHFRTFSKTGRTHVTAIGSFIDFNGNSNYNDGLWYEGWEGNFDLVKINLRNEEVINHIFECIKLWIDEFDIDGLRLDVAYCLDKDFLKRLRSYTDSLKNDFLLLGELLHGDYNQFVNDDMLHSCTNYECYKGIYSSFNSMNMFEIVHSLLRQFGPEQWTLYRGKHLLSFVDNHDVSRIASILTNEKHIPLTYGMIFGMPGIPCVYYGSEWGAKAHKNEGDPALRVCFDEPLDNELSEFISKLAMAHKNSKALCYGDFRSVVLQNKHCIFERKCDDERVLVAINADENPVTVHFDAGCGTAVDLISGNMHDFGGGSELPPYSVQYWKMER